MSDILMLFFIFLGAFFLNYFISRKSKIDREQSGLIRDLERRLTDLMSVELKEIRSSVDNSSKEMIGQVRSFTEETTALKKDLKHIQEKVTNISSFQEIFKSPKLQGQWGEASLEHILSQHYPHELYEIQYLFPSGQQVDAIIKFPNGKILPIDSKFSSKNFAQMIKASQEEKKVYKQKFIEDTRTRIDEITSKYILPSENTLDIAIMYIPAEAIYYEIMFNLGKEGIAQYAWKQKIIITSPNTLYLTLRTIEHWFKDLQFSKKTQEIIRRFERIHQDAKTLDQEFRKLGRHIKNADLAYDRSEKRLSLFQGRVQRLIQVGSRKKELKEPKNNNKVNNNQ